MMRIVAALAVTVALCATSRAQTTLHPNSGRSRPHTGGQPIGVIPPPVMPATTYGTIGTPAQILPPHRFRPGFYANPYYALWGYPSYWPDWDLYQTTPTIVNNYVPVPVSTEPAVQPTLPPELRARLTLHVPPGAKVWVAGQQVDAAVSPLVLESPVLGEGQSYTFDVKVEWREGGATEDRARRVTVEAGQSKSLTYTATR